MNSWTWPVDLYCERTDPSFWAEPVNALTNLAFLAAALAAALRLRATGARDLPVSTLILVTVAVGAGSFAFHTLATRGAILLDVIPIALFIHGYLLLALRRLLGLSVMVSLGIVAGFLAGAQALGWSVPPGTLNGSVGYLPALAAMVAVGALAAGAARRTLFAAAGVFAVSLAFRTVDNAWCASFAVGTHFIWHFLNAVVLYMLLRAAIDARSRDL